MAHPVAGGRAGRHQRFRHAGPAGAGDPDDRQGRPDQRDLAELGGLQRGADHGSGDRGAAGGGSRGGHVFRSERNQFSGGDRVLAAMRLPAFEPKAPVSPWAHVMDGFRYAWHHRDVRRVLAMMAAATLSGMPALVLMPFFADDIFHRGSRGLGFLMGAMGAGAVIGTLVLARRTRVSGLARVMVYSGVMTEIG